MTKKMIIDTDPGVDDAMAILLALSCPEIELLGLTTVFGNGQLPTSTKNALRLVELADRTDIPVAEGAATPIGQDIFKTPADFVHGDDGFGNTNQPEPTIRKIDQNAVDFIIETIRANPGEVNLVALGPLTNLALAIQKDPEIANLVKQVVIMGGAFDINGNVTPVAEANIFNDPVAADIVCTAGWPLTIISLDVTTKVILTQDDLVRLKVENPKYGTFLHDIGQFYLAFYLEHRKSGGMCFHDPSTVAFVIDPTLFQVEKGPVRVISDEGIGYGQTIQDRFQNWHGDNAWTNQPDVQVSSQVQSDRLLNLFFDQMKAV